MNNKQRWVFGIDLGTSHSSVSVWSDAANVEIVTLSQVRAPHQIAEVPLVSSALYFPLAEEVEQGVFPKISSQDANLIVGDYARTQRAVRPERVVVSAKSWLSQRHIDIEVPCLPERSAGSVSDSGVPQISPVTATVLLLQYLRGEILRYLSHCLSPFSGDAESTLASSQVVITVPASFDEGARAATTEAARRAGFVDVMLLEEPLAACYSWLMEHVDDWRDRFSPGDLILVSDVGGGTTDFSLIEVRDDGGVLALERVRVGEHILLGGDNIDLALAHRARADLEALGSTLDSWQFLTLQQTTRDAKELLLAATAPEEVRITIPTRSADLFAAPITYSLARDLVRSIVLDGFFPIVPISARPAKRARVGLREAGLAFAADAAVTRHLAAFLSAGELPRLRAVLCNGGVFIPEIVRERLLDVITRWRQESEAVVSDNSALEILSDTDYRLAVARGAAFFGGLRVSGTGFTIRARTARAYYLGVESAEPAIPGYEPPIRGVCIVPQGVEEGTQLELPDVEFYLAIGDVAEFRLFSSATRPDDILGAVVLDASSELEIAGAVKASLSNADSASVVDEVIPVAVAARLTDVGVLELWLQSRVGDASWRLEWSTRASGSEAVPDSGPDAVANSQDTISAAISPQFERIAG